MYINLIKKRKIIMSITLISVHKKKKKKIIKIKKNWIKTKGEGF